MGLGLASDQDDLRTFVLNYILAKACSDDGSTWTEERLMEAQQESWSSEMLVTFFCGLPPRAETWKRLNRESGEVRDGYWSQVNLTNLRGSTEASEAVENLLAADRPAHALLLCWLNREQLPAELIADSLEQYARCGPEQGHGRVDSWEIQELLAVLRDKQDFDPERLIVLEWMYWEAVGGSLDVDQTMILFEKLSAEPAFFVQLLTWLYKPREDREVEDEAASIPDEQRKILASKAFQVLSAWKGVPGLTSEGEVDCERLRNWITEARGLLKKLGRVTIGDQEIGKVLSRSPQGSDGVWPAEGVREVIEDFRNREIETGIYLGVSNSRGIMAGPGGDQVRAMAQPYLEWAEKLANRWPRTAGFLRSIADSYESEAHHWDQRDEMDDL